MRRHRTALRSALLTLLLAWPTAAPAAEKADLVVVEKSRHQLSLYRQGQRLATYHVVFGPNPVGHKEQEGDGRTPEGRYVLDLKKADSAFYKAIRISYPNARDRADARKRGVSPGGDIMIHGQKNGFGWAAAVAQKTNWTLGCIALTDEDMDAVWAAVDAGTPIEIRP